ncbi:MAG: GNAT family N-acetyltransferase [Candidatus Limivicinus sp.]|jgi:diamine N-acetyltransferase
MNLRIVPVTGENRTEAKKLSVTEDQKDFIEPVTECLREADEISDWETVCIYDGETVVGFAMYGYMSREPLPRLWFDRLLIDRHFQHRGYGRKAVEAILRRIEKEFPGRDIYISAYEDNNAAISLYRSFGFRMNGELDINGEKIMVLKQKK